MSYSVILGLQSNWVLSLTHAAYWTLPVFQHKLHLQSAGWNLQLHKLCSQAQKSVLHIILHRYFNLYIFFFFAQRTQAHKHRSAMDHGIQQITIIFWDTRHHKKFLILKWTSLWWQCPVPHLLSVTLITIESQEKPPFLYDAYTHR